MDDKMNEILNDLNDFHNNLSNIKKINESFQNYIETIAKEKDIIDQTNKETIDKIKYYQENLDEQFNKLEKSMHDFIDGENKTISNIYQDVLDNIKNNKIYLEECCDKYLKSIYEQDKLLKDNQERIKKELNDYLEEAHNSFQNNIKVVNEHLSEVNDKYNQMIRIFSEMDMLNEFKKTRKQNKIIFALLGGVIVAIIVLLIVIILK